MKKQKKVLRLAAGELEILELLWRHGGLTISQAHEAMQKKVGYTTVQIRLNRLVEKKLVRKTAERPASYEAVIQPDAVSRGDLESLVRHVTFGQVVPLVAHLVKDRTLSADEIQELKQLIDDAELAQQSKQNPSRKGTP
jgi:BlaI family penicillinase repressor